MEKTYRIVAKCDPYNAKKHYHGEKVIRRDGATPVEWIHDNHEGMTLEAANAVLLDFARETAGQYIPNWGLAVLHLEKYTDGVASCGTRKDGTRYLTDDTMTYSVFDEVEFSPSSHFIDLGLPSGTQWAVENAVMDGKTHFSFEEAVKTFGNELPSTEAWKELFDHCKREWNEKHKGYTLTGPNGNTLFLPASGYRYGSGLYCVGGYGYYWSRTAYGTQYARLLVFWSGYVDPLHYNYRYYGFAVRLCKSK